LCGEQGIAFVSFFAVSGLRREAAAGREHDSRVHSVADAHHATPAQVRLAWTLHRGPHGLAIPGTRNPAHLAQNIAASLRLTEASLRLTEEELTLLNTAGRPAAASGIGHMAVGTGTGRRPGAGGSSSEVRATTAAITTPGHRFLGGRGDAVQWLARLRFRGGSERQPGLCLPRSARVLVGFLDEVPRPDDGIRVGGSGRTAQTLREVTDAAVKDRDAENTITF
jgi:hypothetical protein